MRSLIPTLAMLLALSAPAAAGPRDAFNLGFAYPGMMEGQFRFGAWPPGTAIYCSDDTDKPAKMDYLLAMPQQMKDIGATRCALLAANSKGEWSSTTRRIAGMPTEMSATFGPDQLGTRRLVQLYMTVPRPAFDALVAHFTSRFGPPQETSERYVHWQGVEGEAMAMHEDGDTAMGMVIDTKLQDLMNDKLNQIVRHK